jgi:hypothetical protein
MAAWGVVGAAARHVVASLAPVLFGPLLILEAPVAHRGPFVRTLIWFAASCGVVLALAGVVLLHGAPLVGGVAATAFAACLTYCAHDAGGPAAVAAALRAAMWTVLFIMVVVGIGVLAGAAVAAVSTVLAAVTGAAVRLWRAVRARPAGQPASGWSAAENRTGVAPTLLTDLLDLPVSVSLLPTSVLGSNWVRTTAAMAYPLVDDDELHWLVERRQETLDELERRDPAGFTGWLVSGNAWDSDPAGFVRSDRTTGTDAA